MKRRICALRTVAGGRPAKMFAGSLLACFGAVSAVIQFVGTLFPSALSRPDLTTAGSLGLCLAWAIIGARPRTRVRQQFTHPGMSVVIETGDLFDRERHLVVGFCDTFDTAVGSSGLVHAGSVQGQLLDRVYDGDRRRLDRDLATALRDVRPKRWERRTDKPVGNLARYPVGTIAVLCKGTHRVFAVAYSRLGNDGVARSTVEGLWFSLNRLWDAVYRHGQQEEVTIPLVGTGLARLDHLGEDSILRLILLSFVTRSRERRVCRQLRIIIRPTELHRIDLWAAAAFLRSLSAPAGR